MGFPGGSVVKNSPANAGNMDSIPQSRQSSGKRKGNPLWYSSLGNSMDRVAWKVVHGVAKESKMTE